MFFINEFLKLARLFDRNKTVKFDREKILFNSLLFLTITACTAYLINYIIIGNTFFITSLSTYIVVSFFLFYLNYTEKVKRSTLAHITFFVNVILELLLGFAVGSSFSIYWGLVFPVVGFAVFGSHRFSMIYSVMFLLLIISFFIVPIDPDILRQHSVTTQISFVSIYTVILLLLATYTRIINLTQNMTEKKILDIKKEIQKKDQLVSDLSFKLRTLSNHFVGVLNLEKESKDNDEFLNEVETFVESLINIVNVIPSSSGIKVLRTSRGLTTFNLHESVKKTLEFYEDEEYKRLKLHLNFSNQLPSKIYADLVVLKHIIISVVDFFYINSKEAPLDLDFIVGRKNISNKGYEILFKVQSVVPLKIIEEKKTSKFINNFSEMGLSELEYIENRIKSMNGKLNLYSDESGTAFLFSIATQVPPTAASKPENIAEKEKKEIDLTIPETTPKDKQNKKIELKDVNLLLVEDDKLNEKLMIFNLHKFVKLIKVAHNGKEAINIFSTNKFDIILMDIRMPFMDGYKTTNKIRETEAGTKMHVPIIAVTANALEGDKEKCLANGMDDYMSKPIKTKELLEKIETLVNKYR